MALLRRFPDRDEVAQVRADAEPLEPGVTADSVKRRLAGRVLARREMGKLVFLDLVDRSGRIQLMVDTGKVGEHKVDLGDIVGVEGSPARTRRGEPSLVVETLELLAKIKRPLPDTFHGVTDVETRYRQRYLDLLMNEESRADAIVRARAVGAVRRFLDEDGFLEVETPVLQPRYGGAFARPFETHSNELDQTFYLRIATELYLKRLIVGGLEKVYELGKDFRNEGVSFKHNPEFTMLEWYEAYADYEDTMRRIEQLVAYAAQETLGTTRVVFRGNEIDLAPPWQRITFVESLERHELWIRDPGELRAALSERGVDTKADKDWPQLLDHAFSHYVEPSLVQPTIVHDYPVELSPFAMLKEDDPSLVERFEFFVGGMELGNAFTELNDADEQQRRFEMQSEYVEGEHGDPDYVEALAYGMPPTGGLGLGIDRLAMVLTGRDSIRDVVLFPALSEPQRLVDVGFPDRWWFYPVASLLPKEWWEEEVRDLAPALLSQWLSLGERRFELLREEASTLSGRHFEPRAPSWVDYKIAVRQSVAAALDDVLSRIDAPEKLLWQLRPEAAVNYDKLPMRSLARAAVTGLAVLTAARLGKTPEALSVQRAFLQRHAAGGSSGDVAT